MWSVAYFSNVFEAQQELKKFTDCYIPCGVKITKPRNKHKPVESRYPVFGQIVFIKFDRKIQFKVQKIRTFRRFITFNGEISLCKDNVIEDLRLAEQEGKFRYDYNPNIETKPEPKPVVKATVKPGDEVVVNGSLVSGTGVVVEVGEEGIVISVNGWNHDITFSTEDCISKV